MSECYVITANDSVECVVVGSEAFAEAHKEVLAEQYFSLNRRQFGGDRIRFRKMVYWAARSMNIVKEAAQ
jgi:hypothetical protein